MAVQTQSTTTNTAGLTAHSDSLSLAATTFNDRLQYSNGNGIADLSPAVLATKRTEASIRAVLRSPELRTAMILDPEGCVESYPILHSIPSRVVVVGVRPSWEGHVRMNSKEMIAVSSASLFKDNKTDPSPFEGHIDILFRYHQGTNDKRNIELADKMLSKHGHYVEFFVPADGSPDRVVTYYTRKEIRELIS